MTLNVTVYRSTDTSAPTLSGTAGTLINVLDACLVNGYGSKAAAGWTKAFSGTNKAAYLMGAAAGSPRMYLRVDDTASGFTANDVRLVGYESMTDVDTGTNAFPTSGQMSGGAWLRKSSTIDSTARPWMVIANEKAFYIWTFCAQTVLGAANNASDNLYFFGAVNSYKSGDAYNVTLIANTSQGPNSTAIGTCTAASSSSPGTNPGHWMARAYTQIGGSTLYGKVVPGTHTVAIVGQGNLTYPDPVSGSLRLARIVCCEPADARYTERGHLPGAWSPQHAAPGNNFDTFSGTGDLSGKTFIFMTIYSTTNAGRIAIEIDGTWGF